MTNLNRNELRIILESLQARRNEWREEIVKDTGALPERETSPFYYELVDLQTKLAKHLHDLPW